MTLPLADPPATTAVPTSAEPTPADRADAAPGWPRTDVRLFTSEQLFVGSAEVQIEHHGAVYRLRKTSLGKLILTK